MLAEPWHWQYGSSADPIPESPMTSVYDSERLAEAYAVDRPPVHEQIAQPAWSGRPTRPSTWGAARACRQPPSHHWPGG